MTNVTYILYRVERYREGAWQVVIEYATAEAAHEFLVCTGAIDLPEYRVKRHVQMTPPPPRTPGLRHWNDLLSDAYARDWTDLLNDS